MAKLRDSASIGRSIRAELSSKLNDCDGATGPSLRGTWKTSLAYLSKDKDAPQKGKARPTPPCASRFDPRDTAVAHLSERWWPVTKKMLWLRAPRRVSRACSIQERQLRFAYSFNARFSYRAMDSMAPFGRNRAAALCLELLNETEAPTQAGEGSLR